MLHHSSLFLYPSLFIPTRKQPSFSFWYLWQRPIAFQRRSLPPPLLCSPLLASVDENISHADILIATCGNILEMLSRSVNFLVIPIFTRRIVRNCDYVRTKFRLCNFSPSYRNDLYVKYSKRHRSVSARIFNF